jgi:hypothetical protein
MRRNFKGERIDDGGWRERKRNEKEQEKGKETTKPPHSWDHIILKVPPPLPHTTTHHS